MDSAVSGDPVNSEEEISLKVRPLGPPPPAPPPRRQWQRETASWDWGGRCLRFSQKGFHCTQQGVIRGFKMAGDTMRRGLK